MLRIVILVKCPSQRQTFLNVDQHRIFQDSSIVESGHSVDNSIYRNDTIPREINRKSEHGIPYP